MMWKGIIKAGSPKVDLPLLYMLEGCLFPDAKILKDITKYIFHIKSTTHNLSQMRQTLAQVLRNEVTRKIHQQTVLYTMIGFEGTHLGFVVADVGYNHIVLRNLRKGSRFYQEGFQFVQSHAVLGGKEEFRSIHFFERTSHF